MIKSATLKLVVLVSCAHALVHVYELSLPSVEQNIETHYDCGKPTTGFLGNCWRLPWGLGALVAGWLVDRLGAYRMLAIFLFGCTAMCAAAALAPPLPWLFVAMIGMGTFASIYHPAGLALISLETSVNNRPRALGIHGIFGSLGIGSAPFLCGAVLATGYGWQEFYWLLVLPGALLGAFFALAPHRRFRSEVTDQISPEETAAQDQTDWWSFFTLTSVAMLAGLAYSGYLQFLPRYLNQAGIQFSGINKAGSDRFLTALVLLSGCLGQYLSGRWARPRLLERQLTAVILLNVPCLIWMAFAQGSNRVVAACLFALVHFMNQPLYNSLIAKYTPRRRRSLCYGFSFMMGLGVGGGGSTFAGYSSSDLMTYMGLAVAALVAALVCATLCLRNRA